MPKTDFKPARPVKDYWFIHGLQALSPEKFLKVVTKILAGEYFLWHFLLARPFEPQLEKRNGRLRILKRPMGG